MTVPLVVDTDGAFDDALAIWLAASSRELDLSLVTTVAGAVPVDRATTNILSLLDTLDLGSVPVHAGASRPQVRALETSEFVLGVNGMSGVVLGPPPVPPPAGLLRTPSSARRGSWRAGTQPWSPSVR